MGFEIFAASYSDGKPAPIALDVIKRAIGEHLMQMDDFGYRLIYGDNQDCFVYIETDGADVDFIVERPVKDQRLWDALYTLLRDLHLVLYYPGARHLVVGNPETARHVPAGMVESFEGGVVLVADGSDLVRRVVSG